MWWYDSRDRRDVTTFGEPTEPISSLNPYPSIITDSLHYYEYRTVINKDQK